MNSGGKGGRQQMAMWRSEAWEKKEAVMQRREGLAYVRVNASVMASRCRRRKACICNSTQHTPPRSKV